MRVWEQWHLQWMASISSMTVWKVFEYSKWQHLVVEDRLQKEQHMVKNWFGTQQPTNKLFQTNWISHLQCWLMISCQTQLASSLLRGVTTQPLFGTLWLTKKCKHLTTTQTRSSQLKTLQKVTESWQPLRNLSRSETAIMCCNFFSGMIMLLAYHSGSNHDKGHENRMLMAVIYQYRAIAL